MNEYLLLLLVTIFGATIGFILFNNSRKRLRATVRLGASVTGAAIGAVFGMAIADAFHIQDGLSHTLFMAACAALAAWSLQQNIGQWTDRGRDDAS